MAEEKIQPEIANERIVQEELEDDEVFYERIEAPKFVDFTTPDHYRPDDRYWFCLRVGCDQKHEEEMDSEKIYKDFVLRVMAARSPNVRLQKALSRRAASNNLKCPLSVPAKCSKSRLSRLAAASTISRKLIQDKEKVNHPSKPASTPKIEGKQVASTPKIKGKQVASKYLTTPRNKNCVQNPTLFRSVQNPKPAALAVPKNRTITRALVFQSPKKAISFKKSVELRTPITKICQGLKNLEITDQKKRLLGYSGKSKGPKGNPRDPPLRNIISHKDKSKALKNTGMSQTRVVKESGPVPSTKIQTQAKLEKQLPSKKMSEDECSKAEVDLTSRDGNEELVTMLDSHKDSTNPEGTNICSVLPSTKNPDLASSDEFKGAMSDEMNCDSNPRGLERNDLPHSQLSSAEDRDGGTEHSIRFPTSEGAGYHDNDMDSDDKENVSVPDENSGLTNNINEAGKVLGVQKMQKVIKKNAQPAAKDLKEGLLSTNANGASGIKSKKPKPTNPKPFRLRTDERGILREADLQRKKQGIVKYPEVENRCTEDNPERDERVLKESQNDLSESGKVRLRKYSTTPERSPATQVKMPNLRKAKSPMESCLRQGQKLTVIQEATAEISKPNKVGKLNENGADRARASTTPSRILSRGRRPLTIPKEPHFHSTHRPKSCTRNLVELVPL